MAPETLRRDMWNRMTSALLGLVKDHVASAVNHCDATLIESNSDYNTGSEDDDNEDNRPASRSSSIDDEKKVESDLKDVREPESPEPRAQQDDTGKTEDNAEKQAAHATAKIQQIPSATKVAPTKSENDASRPANSAVPHRPRVLTRTVAFAKLPALPGAQRGAATPTPRARVEEPSVATTARSGVTEQQPDAGASSMSSNPPALPDETMKKAPARAGGKLVRTYAVPSTAASGISTAPPSTSRFQHATSSQTKEPATTSDRRVVVPALRRDGPLHAPAHSSMGPPASLETLRKASARPAPAHVNRGLTRTQAVSNVLISPPLSQNTSLQSGSSTTTVPSASGKVPLPKESRPIANRSLAQRVSLKDFVRNRRAGPPAPVKPKFIFGPDRPKLLPLLDSEFLVTPKPPASDFEFAKPQTPPPSVRRLRREIEREFGDDGQGKVLENLTRYIREESAKASPKEKVHRAGGYRPPRSHFSWRNLPGFVPDDEEIEILNDMESKRTEKWELMDGWNVDRDDIDRPEWDVDSDCETDVDEEEFEEAATDDDACESYETEPAPKEKNSKSKVAKGKGKKRADEEEDLQGTKEAKPCTRSRTLVPKLAPTADEEHPERRTNPDRAARPASGSMSLTRKRKVQEVEEVEALPAQRRRSTRNTNATASSSRVKVEDIEVAATKKEAPKKTVAKKTVPKRKPVSKKPAEKKGKGKAKEEAKAEETPAEEPEVKVEEEQAPQRRVLRSRSKRNIKK